MRVVLGVVAGLLAAFAGLVLLWFILLAVQGGLECDRTGGCGNGALVIIVGLPLVLLLAAGVAYVTMRVPRRRR